MRQFVDLVDIRQVGRHIYHAVHQAGLFINVNMHPHDEVVLINLLGWRISAWRLPSRDGQKKAGPEKCTPATMWATRLWFRKIGTFSEFP
jgi:hypothetical protein